jgi:hypothetical protein
MKTKIAWIAVVVIIWMLLTLVLTLSLIGLLVILNSPKVTKYDSAEERRSTWMRLGILLIDELIDCKVK